MQQNEKQKFSQLLTSLSPQLLSRTGINEYGSVLQYAALRSPDFIRPLLEHGVDPTVGSDKKEEPPVAIAANSNSDYHAIRLLTLFAEFGELPSQIKIKFVKLLVMSDDADHFDVLQKQIQSLSGAEAEELGAARVHPSYCESEFSMMQFLARFAGKSKQLQLLINLGLDPKAAEVGYTPLEIAATNKNTEAFDLLAPHYEDNTKKKIAQLMIWGQTESVPSEDFKLLFKSVPLDEVNSCTIVEYNLLAYLAHRDKAAAHVAFLLEQGVDPNTNASPENESPMRLACEHYNVATMAELAKYTEPDEEVRSSDVWELVEKELERRWRKDGSSLLRKQQKQIEEQQKQIEKQSRLIKLLVKATGINVEEEAD